MSPARRGNAAAFVLLCLLACLGLSGCAHSLPSAQPPVQTTAEPLTIQGRAGEFSAPQRRALISQLGDQGPSDNLADFITMLRQQGTDTLFADNTVRLLMDGPATFGAMFGAIRQARQSILLESYIFEDQAEALELARLLRNKREEGVDVRVIVDGVGSFGTDEAFFQQLRDGGIAVCTFNPVIPRRRIAYWSIAHRDHRKILVVDGVHGFTGGINISAVYSRGSSSTGGSGPSKGSSGGSGDEPAKDGDDKGWRDTQVELLGPAAQALAELVTQTWQDQACADARPKDPPPASLMAVSMNGGGIASEGGGRGGGGGGNNVGAASAGQRRLSKAPQPDRQVSRPVDQQVVAILPSNPLQPSNPIYATLLQGIGLARHSVWFTMAYFAPGDEMIDALCDAARRGVDVRLLLPSRGDFAPVLHAGRSHYGRLLRAGVKLYEFQDSVLHAKTVVIDGVLSSVGSSNMDWRSFAANNEVNAVVLGSEFGRQMRVMFERDLRRSQAIDIDAWARRPLGQRIKETAAGWLEPLW